MRERICVCWVRVLVSAPFYLCAALMMYAVLTSVGLCAIVFVVWLVGPGRDEEGYEKAWFIWFGKPAEARFRRLCDGVPMARFFYS